MPVGAAIKSHVPPSVLSLVEDGVNGRLAIYAGAGISMGTGLPSGPELATKVHQHFANVLNGYSCDKIDNLTAVADAIAAIEGGMEVLQNWIVTIAPFTSAEPTLAHRLMALLFAEGAVQLLTTNWDDCIERGLEGGRIYTASDSHDAEFLSLSHLLKVHGCCSKPSTLLITEAQLSQPPLWSKGQFDARIRLSTMIFIGIGDVAPCVSEQIEEIKGYLDIDRIRVVSPSIQSKWDDSEWKLVLPELSLERRIPMTADDFCDHLARGWLLRLIDQLLPSDERAWLTHVDGSFGALTPIAGLEWLRRVAFELKVGLSAVRSGEILMCLKAISVLADQSAPEEDQNDGFLRFTKDGSVEIGSVRIDPIAFQSGMTTSQIERVVLRKVAKAANLSGLTSSKVLISAFGIEGPRKHNLSQVDMVSGEPDPTNLITGSTQSAIELIWADKVLESV